MKITDNSLAYGAAVMAYGHAQELARPDPQPAPGTCEAATRCWMTSGAIGWQGHPGKHMAYVERGEAELSVEWDPKVELAG